MILVVLPEGGSLWTLSALRKCGGDKSQVDSTGEGKEEQMSGGEQ